jgi:hypothetical protein
LRRQPKDRDFGSLIMLAVAAGAWEKFKLCEGAPTFCLLLGLHLDKKIDITDHLSG